MILPGQLGGKVGHRRRFFTELSLQKLEKVDAAREPVKQSDVCNTGAMMMSKRHRSAVSTLRTE
jgi:hypothetical protein